MAMTKKRKNEAPEARLVGWVTEDHGQAVFGLSFWPGSSESSSSSYHLAVVGANRANIYDVCPESGSVALRQSYVDDDGEEVLYACSWSCGSRGGRRFAVLAVGGAQGIAKVIDCEALAMVTALAGHGNAINDMCFHPIDECLLLTASKDESVRLWNVRTATLVAVFAGDRGHRDEVLSVDVHARGGVMCSSGMDNTVKVWRLDGTHVGDAVRSSHLPRGDDPRPFPTVFEQFPLFSTARVHANYVDCVRWAGSLLISKSTANRLVLWTPDQRRAPDCGDNASAHRPDGAVLVLRELDLPGADIWFLRFAIDPGHDLVAAGNKHGKVSLWRLDADAPSSPILRLSHPKCTNAVRQVVFAPDAALVAYACDDASVWIYDISSLLDSNLRGEEPPLA